MSPNADPPGADPITQFSAVSKDYAKFRPRYPRALFEWIRSIVDRHALAWDCATGSGQAAVGLADDFAHVEATDANPEQLRHATPHPRITYRQALADRSGLADGTVDVVTVAQALHWLPFDEFYDEARQCRLMAEEAIQFAARENARYQRRVSRNRFLLGSSRGRNRTRNFKHSDTATH